MSDRVDVVVGRRLKARRRLLGLSQKRLGASCGVTFQQIQKYECAVTKLSANMLWKLACALDVEIGYFFTGLTQDGADEGRSVRMEPQPVAQTAYASWAQAGLKLG